MVKYLLSEEGLHRFRIVVTSIMNILIVEDSYDKKRGNGTNKSYDKAVDFTTKS